MEIPKGEEMSLQDQVKSLALELVLMREQVRALQAGATLQDLPAATLPLKRGDLVHMVQFPAGVAKDVNIPIEAIFASLPPLDSFTIESEVARNNFFQIRQKGKAIPALIADTLNTRAGVGTAAPTAPLQIVGLPPGTQGGFSAGILQIKNEDTGSKAGAVITGHNSNGGDKQLWYWGNTSSSNEDVGLINRRVGSVVIWTNNEEHVVIKVTGEMVVEHGVTVGLDDGRAKVDVKQDAVNGAIPTIFLEQLDDSEAMLVLKATVGLGMPIEVVDTSNRIKANRAIKCIVVDEAGVETIGFIPFGITEEIAP